MSDSNSDEKQSVVICGAGLAGSLMVVYLAKRGHPVEVFERRADMRTENISAGKSINLALGTRGLTALDRVGLKEKVEALGIPMPGRMMHDREGRLTFQPYGVGGQANLSVSRRGLNEILMDEAESQSGVPIHFDHKCVDLNLDASEVIFEKKGGKKVARKADLIIGADGAFSAVRGRLQKTDRFTYSQEYISHGYKELTIPPTASGDFAIDPNALHIWPRHDHMMIALPNLDKSFTCTLFLGFEGSSSFATLKSEDQILGFFRREFPDAVGLLPTLLEDFQENPTGSLVTVRCAPHHHGNNVLLIGDAAHAVVPFYGQGMQAAFEDCRVFDDVLDEVQGDLKGALPVYSQRRVADANAIADLALGNFMEMRSHVANPAFLFRKKAEKALHRLMPNTFIPLYAMVSFTNIPYAEAVERARRQDRFLGMGLMGTAASAGALLLSRRRDK
jgi:kynurenine 3-monooxygenase